MIFEKLKEHLNKPSLGIRYVLHRNSRINAIVSVILTGLTAALICMLLNLALLTSERHVSYVLVNNIQNGQIDPMVHECDNECKSEFKQRLRSNVTIDESIKQLKELLDNSHTDNAFVIGLPNSTFHTIRLITQIRHEVNLEAFKTHLMVKNVDTDKATRLIAEVRQVYKDEATKIDGDATKVNIILWLFPLLPIFVIFNIVLANTFFNRKHSKAIKAIEDKYEALKLSEIQEYLGKK